MKNKTLQRGFIYIFSVVFFFNYICNLFTFVFKYYSVLITYAVTMSTEIHLNRLLVRAILWLCYSFTSYFLPSILFRMSYLHECTFLTLVK